MNSLVMAPVTDSCVLLSHGCAGLFVSNSLSLSLQSSSDSSEFSAQSMCLACVDATFLPLRLFAETYVKRN